VQAVSLGNVGEPSSIGTGASGSLLNTTQLNGINLGSPDSSRGGFFSYIGMTNASCNQQVTVFGPTFSTATIEVVGLRNDSPNNSSVHFSNTNPWTYENQGAAGGTNGCEVTLSGVAVTTNTLDAILQDVPNSSAVATPNSGNLGVIGSAWRLTAAQTYSGTTGITNATMIIDGSIAAGLGTTVAAGGVLAGTGTINESVDVLTNATLAAGDGGIGTLTINGNVTNAGTVFMKLNKQAGTNDQIVLGANTFTYGGGVLAVTNLAGTLAVNDAFPLFPAGGYVGTFSSISPATPGPGLAWDMSALPTNGTLKVIAGVTPTSPTITSFSIAGANLTLSGTNGTADAGYNVIGTTNVTLPLTSWTNVTSSTFDGSGNFSLTLTNAIQPGFPHQFFRLQVP
jgi:hypothetical protein